MSKDSHSRNLTRADQNSEDCHRGVVLLEVMKNQLEITTYGRPAHAALARAIDALKAGDPLRLVTVIVPRPLIGQAARRALARPKGIAAVKFASPKSLANTLGRHAFANPRREAISSVVRTAAIRATLSEEPGIFEGVHKHPATETSLATAHRELTKLPRSQFDKLAGINATTDEVIRIVEAASKKLSAKHFTERELFEAAIAAVNNDKAGPTLDQLGDTILFLPNRLPHFELELLANIGQRKGLHTIAATTGNPDADAGVRESIEKLGLTWAPSPMILPRKVATALSLSDADDEVRHALRQVIEAATKGTHFGRCAILYGNSEPYASTTTEALDAAGIPRAGASVLTNASSLMGHFVTEMLALIGGDLPRAKVLSWLTSAPVRYYRGKERPTQDWERISRAAGVVSGLEQWNERLERYRLNCHQQAKEIEHDEDQSGLHKRLMRVGDRSQWLADFVNQLAEEFEAAKSLDTWEALAQWCKEQITKYLGPDDLREDWPDEERNCADNVLDAIDQLARLDRIDPNPNIATFAKALGAELKQAPGQQSGLGKGVFVGYISSAVGLELDLAIVVGMAEGVVPRKHRTDPLLTDQVAATAELVTQAEQTEETHRALLAVAMAAKQTVFSYPRGDLQKSVQRAPSRWLAQPKPQTIEVPSFEAGLRATPFPSNPQEYDMRQMLDWADDNKPFELAPPVKTRPELSAALELLEARNTKQVTRFDGNLSDHLSEQVKNRLHSITEEVSASRLEAWARCPFAFFVRYVLGVEAIEDPTKQYRISPLHYGSLVHKILERWFDESEQKTGIQLNHRAWNDKDKVELIKLARMEAEDLAKRGLVGHEVYWQRDKRIMEEDLKTFCDKDSNIRDFRKMIPTFFELKFGSMSEDGRKIFVRLPSGRETGIRGAIDRADTDKRGKWSVYDYKTGSSDRYKSVSIFNASRGTHLQLLFYALALSKLCPQPATSIYCGYWFVTRKGKFALKGYNMTYEVVQNGLEVVEKILGQIESGLFPHHPAKPRAKSISPNVECPYCEPDGLGTDHQYAIWKRKNESTAITDHLALID